MMSQNYQKYLETKPDLLTTRDVASKYDLSIRKVQQFANLLNIPKDSANIYLFTPEHLVRFENFLTAINRY